MSFEVDRVVFLVLGGLLWCLSTLWYIKKRLRLLDEKSERGGRFEMIIHCFMMLWTTHFGWFVWLRTASISQVSELQILPAICIQMLLRLCIFLSITGFLYLLQCLYVRPQLKAI